MKFKKILSKIMLGLCATSIVVLLIVLFTGCTTSLNIASKNINEYDIVVDYNSSLQTLTCEEEISYINKTNVPLNYIAFHLYPNAFREDSSVSPVSLANHHKAYPNGTSYGNIGIKSVSILNSTATYCDTIQIVQPTYSEVDNFIKNENLTSLQYFIGGEDENILYILFQNKLYPNDRIDINISFEVKLPNINHRFGYGNETVNIANFYPIACVFNEENFDTSLYSPNGDPFYSDISNYNITFKCAKDFIVANTGNVLNKTDETVNELAYIENKEEPETISIEKTIYTLKADAVRDFAIVLSKDFKVLTQKNDITEVKYYYFSDNNPSLSLETAMKSLQTFNELFGNYPYSTLSVVEANFVHGGMEFPNLVYISNDITDEATYQQVIVHEIAHQWWYNLVGNSEITHAWIDEGLAEYSTLLFYELHPEYNKTKESLINNAYTSYALFVQIYGEVYGSVDTQMNRNLNQFNSEQEYVYVAYVKGMLLFDSLREIIGKDTFMKCLKVYFKECCYQNVTPEILISIFEKVSRTNLESYFSAWLDGKIILFR